MRLVCPNCSAQYEIDGSMIPAEGRDVQCSNCGHTWFELPSPTSQDLSTDSTSVFDEADEVEDYFDAPAPYDLDDDDFEEDVDAPSNKRQTSQPDFLTRAEFEDDSDRSAISSDEWDDEPEEQFEPEPEPEDLPETAIEDKVAQVISTSTYSDVSEAADTEPTAKESSDAPGDPSESFVEEKPSDIAASPTPRRPADAAALDILREEAEREMTQRRAPPSDSIEMQTEFGLSDIRSGKTPSRALRARNALMGEEMPEEFAADDPTPTVPSEPARETTPRSEPEDPYEAPRRDLLPDIDEINSTLRTNATVVADPEAVRRSGFRIGFLMMVFLTIAAIFVYAQAPAIARALPDAESTVISYVDWANGVRDWIDGLMGR